jgi:hypothetical protein
MIFTTSILKCVLLARYQTLVISEPINEYAQAKIERVHNGMSFVGDVIEGKLNSVSIESTTLDFKTLSYASRDLNQRSLSTMLDYKGQHASIECEITESL